MKMVIDIPEEQYDLILKSHINANSAFVSKEGMMYAIKNGTPLDNVLDEIRAEIEEMKLDFDLDIGNEMIYNNAIKDVLEIIDKYKAERGGEG